MMEPYDPRERSLEERERRIAAREDAFLSAPQQQWKPHKCTPWWQVVLMILGVVCLGLLLALAVGLCAMAVDPTLTPTP